MLHCCGIIDLNKYCAHVWWYNYYECGICIGSDYFPCNIGVRQGDNLSPLLFALFINDFSHYVGRSYKGLCVSKSCYPSLENEDALFLKLFVLLYADDTIILAENERDLQAALDSVQEYCTKFKLIVNINKTKIIIFSRGKVHHVQIRL